jgi:glycolate oxidase FAD binding subunit
MVLDQNSSACRIDDFGPLVMRRPGSVADLAEIVAQAAKSGSALYPIGGRTKLGFGMPPSRAGLALDLRSINGIVDYPARDMTITLEAGTTLSRLQALLRTENQRLPIDVPEAERATLGGAIATNASGPRRYGHGTLRDYVIGIRTVNDAGKVVRAGGRVVKNVAGYDFCKLHVGALGTLGVIAEVTLKLRPLPEEEAVVLVSTNPEDVESSLDAFHQGRARPVCVELLDSLAVQHINRSSGTILPDAPWILVIGFEGNQSTVMWQVQQSLKTLPGGCRSGVDVRIGTGAVPVWRALVEFQGWSDSLLILKANLLPSATARFCQQAKAHSKGMAIQAHAGNGIVLGFAPLDSHLDQARALLTQWQEWASVARGNAIALRCPAAWKRALPIWGTPRKDEWLMSAVKAKLDPQNLFNPGRFVGGI